MPAPPIALEPVTVAQPQLYLGRSPGGEAVLGALQDTWRGLHQVSAGMANTAERSNDGQKIHLRMLSQSMFRWSSLGLTRLFEKAPPADRPHELPKLSNLGKLVGAVSTALMVVTVVLAPVVVAGIVAGNRRSKKEQEARLDQAAVHDSMTSLVKTVKGAVYAEGGGMRPEAIADPSIRANLAALIDRIDEQKGRKNPADLQPKRLLKAAHPQHLAELRKVLRDLDTQSPRGAEPARLQSGMSA